MPQIRTPPDETHATDPCKLVLSQHSELRSTDVFLALFTLFFSNFTLGRRPSLLVSVPFALTRTLHFLGTNSLVVGFRSKTVFLSLKC